MPDVFLSYSREDQATVRRYAEALEREGFKVWWDAALHPGETFDQVTEQALKQAKAVVVLWSKHSVISRWVRSEATQADRFGTLVPVMIEACDRPILFELSHTSDLSAWTGDRSDEKWRALVASLNRLVGSGDKALANTVSSQTAAAPLPTTASLPRKHLPALAWAAIAAAIIAGLGLLWYFQGRSERTSGAATGAGVTASATSTAASIAVLPFRDMSQNKDQEYFADGVTEEILNTLASLKDLKVTARTSAFAFKGKDVDLRTVGETLGVQHILEGSIRKDGQTLRITAQLIDAQSDAHVWSKTYDRPLQDIFKVQEEIARSVAEALQVTLGVGFGDQPGMTRNVDAYDAGLEAWHLRLQQTAPDQRRAIALLEKATTLDPTYGNAWLYLASTYGGMAGLATGEVKAWEDKADAALLQARRLSPDSPGVHFVLAERSISRKDWAGAAGHLDDLAAATSRRGTTAPRGNGRFLLMTGRAREALAALQDEQARDPLNPEIAFFLGVAYSAVGDLQAATAEFERGYSLDVSWHYLFQVAALSNSLATQDRADVRRRMEALVASSAVDQRDLGTTLVSLLDRPAEAQRYLRERVGDPSTSALALGALSQYLAYFGDPQGALESHRLAFERGGVNPAIFSIWYPVMREVRSLPEFRQLLSDLGLVDYWRQHGWGDFCKPVGDGEEFECH